MPARDLTGEPITLADAKSNLGIRGDHRDVEIARDIVAARERVELYTGRALRPRVFTQDVEFPEGRGRLQLDFGPVRRVLAVRYLDTAENLVEVAPIPSRVIQLGNRWFLFPAIGEAWPVMGASRFAQVEYEAGYRALDAAADAPTGVPAVLEQAMHLLIGTWFENHEGGGTGSIATELPFGVKDLCRDFRPGGVA